MVATTYQRVKRGQGWIVLAVAVVGLMVYGVGRSDGRLSPAERVESISKRLACPVCDGESVFESRNTASNAIRNEIEVQVAGGVASDDEIITFIEQRYGGQVLLVPKAEGVDALVWILPVVAAAAGVTGLALVFRKWRRAGTGVVSDEDRALVARALRDELGRSDEPDAPDRSGD